ncbi:MAG: glutamate--tRNA ligase [Myxococcales bacterium]|nr:MAG: glutamate--tRNA ligase [Myxococcales bacterium]
MPQTVRVRFAPSPTGYLHIGGVRTALFSWLWAKKNGGKFILRIEDTDQERSTEQSVQCILDSMRWLGLDWDEGPEVGGEHGPYFQTQRLDIYATYAERLIAQGKAYRCYCTKEDLAAAREAHAKSGTRAAFKYPGTCRDIKDDASKKHVVRFIAPTTGSTGWVDLVKGRIDVPNDTQQDFVILRPGGIPLYNFGCVVDDAEMKITLVTRGDDHVINTPMQIMMYEAMGLKPPAFAHLPMILAPNGEKLSKRHAAVAALDYRDSGYLADGVLNYLARLGWSHGDQEIFTRDELIEKFNWEHVGSTAGRYDAKKFLYVQASHLRMLDDAQLANEVLPFLSKRGVTNPDMTVLKQAVATAKSRASTLIELAEMIDFYLLDTPVFDEKAKNKFLGAASIEALSALKDELSGLCDFSEQALEDHVKAWLEPKGYALKDIAQPARVALTGRTKSPGLFEMMAVLGKDKTMRRIEEGVMIAKSNS